METEIAKIEKELDKEIAAFLISNRFRYPSKLISKHFTYENFLNDKMLIIYAIRIGIPYSLFELIQSFTPFSENDWADILDISSRSLQRYKVISGHHFKRNHSEKIIEMAEVAKLGLDVFGNMEKLKLWLDTPNFALGSKKPLELLKDSYGKELVISELTRINHGILV